MVTTNNKINEVIDIAREPDVNRENYEKLLHFLRDNNTQVQLEALEVIEEKYKGYLKPQHITFLLNKTSAPLVSLTIQLLHKLKLKNNKIFSKALKLLHCKDWMIITDMIEVLNHYTRDLEINNIRFLLSHKNPIVRRDAFILFGQLPNTKAEILSLLTNERKAQARLGAYHVLYLGGEKQYLQNIIELMFKTKDYRARYACFHTLFLFLSRQNFRRILESYEQLQKLESTKGLKKDLNIYIKKIKHRYKKALEHPKWGYGL